MIEKDSTLAQPAERGKELMSGSSDTKRHVLVALLLAMLGVALFSRAISYGFLNYDDDLYVYRNQHVLNGLSASGISYALKTSDIGTWAPLTWLSYECDTSLQGARAASYHTTNIVFHAAAGALLFLALCAMGQSLWLSVTVALLFIVHPLRNESVVWIAERKDVLCAFFWMLGLLAYARYARKPDMRTWVAVFLCFLAGLMSKMMMVTFPFVLLLLDFWPLKRVEIPNPAAGKKIRQLILEKLPFFAAIILVVLISAAALRSRGAFSARQSEGVGRLLRVPQNYAFYLGKSFWPEGLSILYPIQPVQKTAAVLCTAFLALVTLAVVWQSRKSPCLVVGWLWFIGTLVPVVGFVAFGDAVVADRYTYIASVGIIWGIAAWAEPLALRFSSGRWLATAGLAVACAALTSSDLVRWRNSLSLYDAALRLGPHYVAYNNRGVALLEAGQTQAALDDFNLAIKLKSDYSRAYNNRGSIWSDQRHYDDALRDFDTAIKNDPYYADAYDNRGNVLARRGQPDQAMKDYARCIELDPLNPSFYNNRAAAFFQMKRFQEAKADIDRCQELGGQAHPGLVQALDEALKSKP